ncbi:ubiquitin carboxyl-terminal hydrolase Yuh1p [[Candida] jaroonii]|uniref:Ubiquitin carboxyl-terminal hydrolase Yuh1p n=1 Tax=[Candida] jaroonii TaxID=467808 RepID=A0ACA9YBL1_9ASCO|nr:ubiquitin carboxyl-terminal hydrolase Yuh1p [[Candida] jaroonii]
MGDSKRVIPLESNPTIFNDIGYQLGLVPVLEFHDVLSLTDPDLLAFLPQPIYGIIMLFPITEEYEQYRKKFDSTITYDNDNTNVQWFKQTIGNGCGLYGLLHIMANLPQDLIIDNSIINKFLLSELKPGISVEDTAKLVEKLEHAIQLDDNYGRQGQTEAPSSDVQTEFHFISFIKGKDNHLYELDGRRKGPVDLGESIDGSNILNDSKLSEKIQFYINNTNEENKHNFAMIAIGPTLD